jgi:2-desacetyl-2-hydroxyethyl bacteriochlorophyllide A dehydrogenase
MEGRAHYTTGGGFAKYTVWPEYQLHVLPASLNPMKCVLVEPTAGSVHSVITRMKVRAGETVCIMGPGARGILMMQVCKAIGAGPVIMTGVTRDEPFRLKMAKELGADYIVNVDKQNIRDVVKEVSGGIGVDVVLENTGAVEPIEESLDIARKGGRILWAGGGIRGGITAKVDTHKIIVKELDIRGEISQMPYDWETAIKLISTGKVKLDPLVTHSFDLDHWESGFDLAHDSHDCLRVALDLTGEKV